MKIFWTLGGMPELAELSHKERNWLYARHREKNLRGLMAIVHPLLYLSVYFAVSTGLSSLELSTSESLILSIPVYLVAGLILELPILNLSRKSMAKEVEFWQSVGFIDPPTKRSADTRKPTSR